MTEPTPAMMHARQNKTQHREKTKDVAPVSALVNKVGYSRAADLSGYVTDSLRKAIVRKGATVALVRACEGALYTIEKEEKAERDAEARKAALSGPGPIIPVHWPEGPPPPPTLQPYPPTSPTNWPKDPPGEFISLSKEEYEVRFGSASWPEEIERERQKEKQKGVIPAGLVPIMLLAPKDKEGVVTAFLTALSIKHGVLS